MEGGLLLPVGELRVYDVRQVACAGGAAHGSAGVAMSRLPKCRVTVPRKRCTAERVFVCLGCDRLTSSSRAHAITCSPACRVRLHRHPEPLRQLEGICAQMDTPVPRVLDARAVMRLRPDLEPRIMAGELTLADAQPEVWQAFVRLAFAAAHGEVQR